MLKIGIISIFGNKNYGNKLQNYALKKYLEGYNCDVYTIIKDNGIIKNILKIVKRKLFLLLLPNNSKTIDYKRETIFSKFTNKYLQPYKINKNKIKLLDNFFDFYVIGSDQVWNPDVIDKYFGLRILDNNKPSIAYAASLGLSVVDDNYKKKVSEKFTKDYIKYISLREDTGNRIISSITKRDDIETLIDPTLLLKENEWDELIKKPNNLETDKFILCYFLGKLSDKRKKSIEEYAKKENCTIINILDNNSKYYLYGPEEFLYLEKYAKLVCTDSFHSCVFAFIYNTPFVIFDREDTIGNMSSRVTNFISKFKLENRKYNNRNIIEENTNHDYSEGYRILEQERKKSDDFLRKALDVKDSD